VEGVFESVGCYAEQGLFGALDGVAPTLRAKPANQLLELRTAKTAAAIFNLRLGLFRHYSAQMRGGSLSRSAQEHSDIITAIERRQPDQAEERTRKHIANSREIVMQHLRKPGAT
jgi:DNA-binding GntR family transcriptional regulator